MKTIYRTKQPLPGVEQETNLTFSSSSDNYFAHGVPYACASFHKDLVEQPDSPFFEKVVSFEVGDWVKCIESNTWIRENNIKIGDIFRVEKTGKQLKWIKGANHNYWLEPIHFTLATPEEVQAQTAQATPPKYIVFERTGEVRLVKEGEWHIDLAGDYASAVQDTEFKYPILTRTEMDAVFSKADMIAFAKYVANNKWNVYEEAVTSYLTEWKAGKE